MDDDEFTIELISRLLHADACQVSGFTNPKVCLSYLTDVVPAFLFVDMKMPRMNGLEFIEDLKRRGSDHKTKIYLCSGAHPPRQVCSLLSAMDVEFILKDNMCNKDWLRNKLGFCDK